MNESTQTIRKKERNIQGKLSDTTLIYLENRLKSNIGIKEKKILKYDGSSRR